MHDDFPENGTAEEKKRWKLRKTAEEWWYKKLMSEEAEEYHEKENNELQNFCQKNNRKLFKRHKGNLKCTSTSVIKGTHLRLKLEKRAEEGNYM